MDGDSPVDLTGCRIIAGSSRATGSTSLFRTAESRTAASRFRPTMLPQGRHRPCSRLVLSRCCGMRASGILRRFPFYPRRRRPLSTLSAVKPIVNSSTVQASAEYPLLKTLKDGLTSLKASLDELMESAKAAEEGRQKRQKTAERRCMTSFPSSGQPLPCSVRKRRRSSPPE